MEPVLAKAARKLGIDQVEIRKINAPAGKAPFGAPAARGQQNYVTSAFVKEALDKGAELFNWEEKKARSGKRVGHEGARLGVAVSTYSAGSIGFDGLLVIKPDGKVQFQSGIGNLGTHSVFDVHRVAAEMLGVPWEQCDVVWGNTSKHLPWTCVSGGSQTTHAMTRAAHAAGTDANEDAAGDRGEDARRQPGELPGRRRPRLGRRRQHDLRAGGAEGDRARRQVRRPRAAGGRQRLHEDVDATALAGQGLMAAARDNYPRDGQSQSYVVGFAEVEVDVETGAYHDPRLRGGRRRRHGASTRAACRARPSAA